MKYDRIDNSLYIQNRKNFSSRMESRALAVFNSNDIITTSADSTRSFKQHTDILWLSGVDQEESILVLFPECHNPNHRELLFLKETNEHIAIWEGEKLDKTAAIATSDSPIRTFAVTSRSAPCLDVAESVTCHWPLSRLASVHFVWVKISAPISRALIALRITNRASSTQQSE